MSNNIAGPINMTKGFLVFKFHPQFRPISSQTLVSFYESRRKTGRDKTLKRKVGN